jgi:hypothetical protein
MATALCQRASGHRAVLALKHRKSNHAAQARSRARLRPLDSLLRHTGTRETRIRDNDMVTAGWCLKDYFYLVRLLDGPLFAAPKASRVNSDG